MNENELSQIIIDAAIEVHRTLGGPGLLENVYRDGMIIECKAVTTYNPIFESQLLTYLRLTDLKLGLVINFGQRLVKHGIHRVVNGLDDNR